MKLYDFSEVVLYFDKYSNFIDMAHVSIVINRNQFRIFFMKIKILFPVTLNV